MHAKKVSSFSTLHSFLVNFKTLFTPRYAKQTCVDAAAKGLRALATLESEQRMTIAILC